jgi:hypothetical protein
MKLNLNFRWIVDLKKNEFYFGCHSTNLVFLMLHETQNERYETYQKRQISQELRTQYGEHLKK